MDYSQVFQRFGIVCLVAVVLTILFRYSAKGYFEKLCFSSEAIAFLAGIGCLVSALLWLLSA